MKLVAWAAVASLAIYFGMVGLYVAFGRAGALAIPLAMLATVVCLTIRDEWRRRRVGAES